MKIMFASDVHGDAQCAKAMLDAYRAEGAEKLCLLGDLLYHGPRNELPEGYLPKRTIELLNEVRDELLCVRGNCDGEVDQMVLDFPILSELALVLADGITICLTHGHKYNVQEPPPMAKGDVLVCGHTHVPCIKSFGKDNVYINVGSVSIPKENNERTYAVYENGMFVIRAISDRRDLQKIKIR